MICIVWQLLLAWRNWRGIKRRDGHKSTMLFVIYGTTTRMATDSKINLVSGAKDLDEALACMYNHVYIVNAFLLGGTLAIASQR